MLEIKDSVAVITGGASGIGLEMSKYWLKSGGKENMPSKVLDKIVGQVPIGRLVEPEEVAAFVGDLYRNEALAGDVFFIHGGLRLSAKG